MKTIAVFAGTRPEAIKIAPIVRAAAAREDLEVVLVSTGQHRDMLDPVFDIFEIVPAHRLDVMQPEQTLATLTANLTTAIDQLFRTIDVDFSICQGDTTTAFVSALVSFYHQVPVGHVEAGLRSHDLHSPFPEEGNRTLISRLATLHFAPTAESRANLTQEGLAEECVVVTGNTVIDALHLELARQELAGDAATTQLSTLLGGALGTRPYVLITGHRRENFGHGFEEICAAIGDLAGRFPDHDFVYPVHLNPNVQRPVHARLGEHTNVKLIPPQGYSQFVTLMQHCTLTLTDSGGIQEEAPSLGKPVLVMRDNTERPEGVAAGTVKLVGPDRHRIVAEVSALLTNPAAYERMAQSVNPYGDGQASHRILEAASRYLDGGS